MKEYQKPEIELISLVAQEKITIGDDIIDASTGLQPVPPGLWD